MLDIYVDADACPVKQEVCRVAERYGLKVTFVSNSRMRIPEQDAVELVVVTGKFDAADDWIAEHVTENDIVVTADIPLASRCIKNRARVLGPAGQRFTAANIGSTLATRDLMSELRGAGAITGGPPPFQKQDRSRFLQGLDQVVQDVKKCGA
ncbi:MAG: hypothetical protein A3K19_02760 [Lentisphaerae bacterium RIFOXYB12_FULL_65_16]|nr:MAG: hypothetical protein A3K18_19810 [Lentisphaerae bacterium RIFOXYA12_64_32]OGV92273.1 MAG: hypothetical protein A3K19_02760 [Lentisphaerae bacterium RIFOXYB12_FULL_65_16]